MARKTLQLFETTEPVDCTETLDSTGDDDRLARVIFECNGCEESSRKLPAAVLPVPEQVVE